MDGQTYKPQNKQRNKANGTGGVNLGQFQTMEIVKKVDFGVYLSPEGFDTKVLLPKNQVPEEARTGDILEVFIYKDSSDRVIATLKKPKLVLGELAELMVAQTSDIGAFLDWGLERDLFLPFKEQTCPLNSGDMVFVALYLDKSERLAATMRISPYLKNNSKYDRGSRVSGRVYSLNPEYGAFVAIDDCYNALLPQREVFDGILLNDTIECRVSRKLDDGKLELSMTDNLKLQIPMDCAKIVKALKNNEGFLPFSDKSDPEEIRKHFAMSKKEFKRVIGNLYKMGEIDLTDEGIKLRHGK